MMLCSLKEGFKLHTHIIKTYIFPTIFTFNQLIHLYSKHGLLREAHQLFDEMPERNIFTWNTIIYAHINNQDLSQARLLFDATPNKDSVTYNSMITGYANAPPGSNSQAFQLFFEMQDMQITIDDFTLTTMLNLTAKLSVLTYGKQLHSYMVKSGNDLNGFAVSSLIDMYSKCGCFRDAVQVFTGSSEIIHVDLVSKNAVVAACCRQGEMKMALELFWRCSEFNDSVSWTTLLSGYSQNGYLEEALQLFVLMREKGIRWNEHTLTSVLSVCSSLRNQKGGKQVHAWVLKTGLSSNLFINSGLVDMYCKCDNIRYAELVHAATSSENAFSITSLIVEHSSLGNMIEARKLFDSLNEKNSVVWTAMFSGYVRFQQCGAVFELFREYLKHERSVPDVLILISLLGACAIQAALDPGKQIHTYVLRIGIEIDKKLSSSMVDMYAKCGEINYAKEIFKQVSDKDRVLYNTMIAGYAHHGYEIKAIGLFDEMLKSYITPDVVTFIALLSACRHAGLVELGETFFGSMTKDYGLLPEIDHYSCMIDLLGRVNELEKAVKLMKKVPVEELDAVILGTFLNACKMNGNVKLARETEDKLLKIEADNGARYVQLANAYAAEGDWTEMSRIRRKMKEGEVHKLAGCSWVYVDNRVSIFTSGDRFHLRDEAIYSILACLNEFMEKSSKIEIQEFQALVKEDCVRSMKLS